MAGKLIFRIVYPILIGIFIGIGCDYAGLPEKASVLFGTAVALMNLLHLNRDYFN